MDNKVVARAGVVSTTDSIKSTDIDLSRMPILRNVLGGGDEVYLLDVQVNTMTILINTCVLS